VLDISWGRTPVAARVVPTPTVKTEMNANNKITTNRWLRLRKKFGKLILRIFVVILSFLDFTGLPITEFYLNMLLSIKTSFPGHALGKFSPSGSR
jgi:hypothetical protein